MIGGGHFKGRVDSTSLACLLQQSSEKIAAITTTTHGRINGHNGDLQLIDHEPTADQAKQGLAVVVKPAKTQPVWILQFTAPLVQRPETVQTALIKGYAGSQRRTIEITDRHAAPLNARRIPTLPADAAVP